MSMVGRITAMSSASVSRSECVMLRRMKTASAVSPAGRARTSAGAEAGRDGAVSMRVVMVSPSFR